MPALQPLKLTKVSSSPYSITCCTAACYAVCVLLSLYGITRTPDNSSRFTWSLIGISSCEVPALPWVSGAVHGGCAMKNHLLSYSNAANIRPWECWGLCCRWDWCKLHRQSRSRKEAKVCWASSEVRSISFNILRFNTNERFSINMKTVRASPRDELRVHSLSR